MPFRRGNCYLVDHIAILKTFVNLNHSTSSMPENYLDPVSREEPGMSDFWLSSDRLIQSLLKDIDKELDTSCGNALNASSGEGIDDLPHKQEFPAKTDSLANSDTTLHFDSEANQIRDTTTDREVHPEASGPGTNFSILGNFAAAAKRGDENSKREVQKENIVLSAAETDMLPPNNSSNVHSTDLQAPHPTTIGSHTRRPSFNSVFTREIPPTTPPKQTTTLKGHWTETQRIVDLKRLDTPDSGQVSSVFKTTVGSGKRKKKPKSRLHRPSSGLPHSKSTTDDMALADALAAKQAKMGPADSVGGSDATSGSQQEPNGSTSTFRCGILPPPSYGGDYGLRKAATAIEKTSNSLPSTVLAAKIQEVMKSKNTMNLGNALTSEVLESMTLDQLRVAFKRTQGERTVAQVNLDASNLPGSLCTIRQLLELTKGDVYKVASTYSIRIYPLPWQPMDAEPWYCGGFCRIMIGSPEDSEAVQWRNTILQYPNDLPPSVVEAFKSWSLSQGTMRLTRASAPHVMLSLRFYASPWSASTSDGANVTRVEVMPRNYDTDW
ncbi:hypothetical protein TREMEDRAFT_58921 [Tremella mesenterica DSM 1558]|uniref:uncharacterized protein n=1 Tax=Tremella mesenterica (strain ATCC 24925 / CBS 8224 / DSM 1558 / NBRC 9311 / NRRL Y-6157 / RJB 2259-6 / UBC 559-6) TaxID=578456 RepID=UPI0003F49FE3|nr:uncharacterized protein TREMEDRAFT_58921 [Tremella mesenterica DSM 1558]EIW72754.1 hypothetical protein TREMEDRAFT_58921 [Tremella mesenterica DSM 1558]